MIDKIINMCRKNKVGISIDYNDQTGQAALIVAKTGAQGFRGRRSHIFEPNIVEALIDTQAAPIFDVKLETLIDLVEADIEIQEKEQLRLDDIEAKGDQGHEQE